MSVTAMGSRVLEEKEIRDSVISIRQGERRSGPEDLERGVF